MPFGPAQTAPACRHSIAPYNRRCKLAQSSVPRKRRNAVPVVCAAAAVPLRTHYDVLGVRDTASVRDVKDAFRRLALMWHPDRCKQPGAKDKFMELKAAYDTLVDLTARAKYDLQLRQQATPPPAPAATGPTAVGYDWGKYRTSSVRRAASVRKTTTAAQQQQSTGVAGNPFVPPKPPARSSSGDDFDLFTRASASDGASSYSADNTARSASTTAYRTTASPTARTASTAAGSGGGSRGYQSIFGSGGAAGPGGAAAAAAAAAPGRSQSVHSSGAGSIFNRAPSSSHQAGAATAGNVSAFSRSSSRSSSRSRYSRSTTPSRSSSASAWSSSRSSSPTPAQQWHSMYCHSGDDFVAASGTSYAATTALVRASAYTSTFSSGATGSPWHQGVAGDGFRAAEMPASSDSTTTALVPYDHSSTVWRSAAAEAAGDDYHANQHALVRVEQTSALVPAASQWSRAASFISVRMN